MEIKQSTVVEIPFLMLDSAGAPVEGASPIVTVRKPGGSFAAATNSPVEDADGHYHISLTATETNTTPFVIVHAEAAGSLNADMLISIAANVTADSIAAIAALNDIDGAGVEAAVISGMGFTSGNLDTFLSNFQTTATAINNKTINLPASPAAVGSAMTLTSGERTAVAVEVESHLLDEGDSQMLINAIVGAIGNTNVDEAVLVAAIRADLERVGGMLALILEASGTTIPDLIAGLNDYDGSDSAGVGTLLSRLTALRAGYLDKLNVSGALAHSDSAASYKADVSGLATSVEVAAAKGILDRLDGLVENSGGDRFTAKALEQGLVSVGGGGDVTGAYTITLTVTDGEDPLEGARVRVGEGVTFETYLTDAAGQAVISRDAGTYQVAATKDGYDFTPTTRTVTGDEAGTLTEDIELDLVVTVPSIDDPDLCEISLRSQDIVGVALSGLVISIKAVSVLPAVTSEGRLLSPDAKTMIEDEAIPGRYYIGVQKGFNYSISNKQLFGSGSQSVPVALDATPINVKDLIE